MKGCFQTTHHYENVLTILYPYNHFLKMLIEICKRKGQFSNDLNIVFRYLILRGLLAVILCFLDDDIYKESTPTVRFGFWKN